MTLAANSQGVVLGQFDIPAETILAGTKLVEFFGAGGSYASSTYIGGGKSTVKTVKTIRKVYFYDPLGESFGFEQDTELAGIDVWFTATSASRIVVQLREGDNGVPGQNIIAESYILPNAISLTTWTRALFTSPVTIPAHREYFVVFLTDDATAAIKKATLGEFDPVAQQWCTRQPWSIGVMVDSSNNQSWTIHNDSDLTFRLVGPVYSPTSQTIALDPITVVDADYAVVLAAVDRPTADCEVIFTLELPGGETFETSEEALVLFPSRQNGEIEVSVTLIGTEHFSPKVARDLQVITGKSLSPSTYVTRRIPIAADPNNLDVKITVILEALLPSPATVTVEAHVDGDWEEMTIPTGGDVQIGDNWHEFTYVLDDVAYTNVDTALRITLTGSALARPIVRNLRCIIVST